MSGEEPDSPLAYRDAGQLQRDVELVRDAAGAPGRSPTAPSRTSCAR